MSKTVFALLAMALAPFGAYAVDGVVLINQSTLTAAGGTYTISQPGSYKLSGNLQAKDTNTTPIVVTADNVTIDLNGFTISGTNVCAYSFVQNAFACTFTTAQNGIDGGGSRNLTVSNGTVSGMGQFGINTLGVGSQISSVTVTYNGSDGIRVGSGLIDRCRVVVNGAHGIHTVGEAGSLQKSFLDGNNGYGLTGTVWGYSQNTFSGNNPTVNGGFGAQVNNGLNLGQNQCNQGVCPGAAF